ncbi:MAG: signal recognition particle-docking protein FtsY [Prochlorotrichaceae cyanobacterium]|jgi:fused signal recognition particle receptor
MVFDWFRRKFDKSAEKTEPSAVPEETLESTVEAEAPVVEEAEAAPEDEYLAWAKAAYQNLKQQQAPVTAPSAEPAPTPVSDRPEAAAVETVETPEVVEPPEAAEDLEPLENLAPEPEATEPEATEPIEPVLDTASAAPEPSEPVPATTAPRSLLDRGSADRQARLEQLKAEALAAEPDPEPAPAETPPSKSLAFDEDFIWSAEVLAREGREPDQVSEEEITWLSRLRQGLDKTRRGVVNQLKATIGQGPLNEDAVLTLEALLLQADVGVQATDYIIQALQKKLREEALPPDQAIEYLKEIVRNLLDRPLAAQGNPVLAPEHDRLNIWLVTGVNGAGKTTTIGKLAHLAQKSGYRCLIAAADTFRAAAVQQVQVWGDRTGVEVIANPGKNTDPAAVVFDALAAAQSRQTELLLVDTAGRLQNKKNLMAELSKIRKTIDKKAGNAIVESLLVLDATLGQNGLRQAEVFGEAADLTGVVLTKLDGTAKGGVALGVVEQLNLPIRFIGAGEKITDLRPFSSYEFVEALLNG